MKCLDYATPEEALVIYCQRKRQQKNSLSAVKWKN